MEARQSVRQTLKDLMNGSSIAVDQYYKLGKDGKDLDVKPTHEAYSYEFNKNEISFAPKIIIKLNLISFNEMLLIALMVDEDRSKVFSECSFVPLNSFLHLLISNDALKKWDICLECPYEFKGWENTEKIKMEKKMLKKYEKVCFATRNEAQKVLDRLINNTAKNGEVTVEDFICIYANYLDFSDLDDRNHFWTLADAVKGKVYQGTDKMFYIDLPEPHKKELKTEEDSVLFYDDFTGKYFRGKFKEIQKIVDDLNKKFMESGILTLSEYAERLGTDNGSKFDEVGWSLEFPNFNISPRMGVTPDGKSYLRITADHSINYIKKNQDPVLSIWYDDLMISNGNLIVTYNDGSEENYKHHVYSIEGKGWKDCVFEMAKYLYSFMDEVFDDVYGESAFTPDMISRNAVWMALDAIDHERREIEYNLSDPEEYDRITDL